MSFKEKQKDVLTVLTDENDKPVYALRAPNGYNYLQISSDKIANGKYKLYTGGAIVADSKDGVYENITSYSLGTQMQHGGKVEFNFPEREGAPSKDMAPPEAMTPPEGAQPPEGFPKDGKRPDFSGKGESPKRPEGMENMSELPRGRNPMDLETEVSDIFEITDKAKSFVNIQPKAE